MCHPDTKVLAELEEIEIEFRT